MKRVQVREAQITALEHGLTATVEEIKTRNGDVAVQILNAEEGSICYIENLLSPMLYILAICGCYTLADIRVVPNKTAQRKTTICGFAFVYRLVIITLLFLYLVKAIAAFFYLSNVDVYLNIMGLVWYSACFAWFLIFWKNSSFKFGKRSLAFQTWDETIVPKFAEMNLDYPIKRVKRIVTILVVIAVVIVITNVAGLGVQFLLGLNVTTHTSPFETNGYIILFVMVSALYASSLWSIASMYAATMTFVLKYAFQTVTKATRDGFRSHTCSVPPDFQKLRILHSYLSNLVSELDEDLGWFYGSLCASHILLACFALYIIIRVPMDIFSTCQFIFWLVSVLTMTGSGASLAAMVNTEAHAPLNTVYCINVTGVNMEKLAQIHLFLSRLTGTQIGFSTCGLLVITKEFILTIAGVFLTYFAVLYTL